MRARVRSKFLLNEWTGIFRGVSGHLSSIHLIRYWGIIWIMCTSALWKYEENLNKMHWDFNNILVVYIYNIHTTFTIFINYIILFVTICDWKRERDSERVSEWKGKGRANDRKKRDDDGLFYYCFRFFSSRQKFIDRHHFCSAYIFTKLDRLPYTLSLYAQNHRERLRVPQIIVCVQCIHSWCWFSKCRVFIPGSKGTNLTLFSEWLVSRPETF